MRTPATSGTPGASQAGVHHGPKSDPDLDQPSGWTAVDGSSARTRRRWGLGAVLLSACWLVIGALPGLVVAVLLFRPILDPRNMGWLFSPKPELLDIAQSGVGWLYFSHDQWRWPIGSNPHYGGDVANSLLFSDSTPAFDIPMKLLFSVFGDGGSSQIIGLSLLTCLVLQSLCGYLIMRRLVGGRVLPLLAACFVVTSPVLLVRWNINSLFWQWLVLASILVVVTPLSPWRRTAVWTVLVMVSTGITPYVALMLIGTAVVDHLVRGLGSRAWLWAVAGPVVIGLGAFTALYSWGTFSIPSGAAPLSDLGLYSANLLALIDSFGLSYFVRDVPGGTGEGNAYVGAGVIVLLLLSLGGALRARSDDRVRAHGRRLRSVAVDRPAPVVLVVSALVLFALATIPKISLGGASWTLPLPMAVQEQLATFRANGRWAWMLMYGVILAGVWFGSRALKGRRGTALVAAALVLQLVDLMPAYRYLHTQVTDAASALPRFQQELTPILSQPGIKAISVVPAFPFPPDVPFREISLAAEQQGIPMTTMGYFNRYDVAAVVRKQVSGMAALQQRALRSDTIYIVQRAQYDTYLKGYAGAEVLFTMDGDWLLLRSTAS